MLPWGGLTLNTRILKRQHIKKQFCLSDTNLNHYIAQLAETLSKLRKKYTVTF